VLGETGQSMSCPELYFTRPGVRHRRTPGS
jgi:hypothetical protein